VPYPRAGDNPAFTEALQDELGAATAAPASDTANAKRGPGRPPGTGKNQRAAKLLNEQQVSGLDESVVVDMWKLPFELIAMSRNLPAWKLSDREAVALAKPSVTLLHHYAPGKVDPIQLAWYQLGGTLATLAVSRMLQDRARLQAKAAATKKADQVGKPKPAAGGGESFDAGARKAVHR